MAAGFAVIISGHYGGRSQVAYDIKNTSSDSYSPRVERETGKAEHSSNISTNKLLPQTFIVFIWRKSSSAY